MAMFYCIARVIKTDTYIHIIVVSVYERIGQQYLRGAWAIRGYRVAYIHPLPEMGKIKLLTKWSKYFVITNFV